MSLLEPARHAFAVAVIYCHPLIMPMSLTDAIVVPEDVVFRELEGETVLLNLKTGTYFGLDPIGTRIWQLVVERGSLEAVLNVLVTEYEAERAALMNDLLNLSQQLLEHGLIAVVNPAETTGSSTRP